VIDSAVGADPGPATGLCFLEYSGGRLVGRTLVQATGDTAAHVLHAVLAYHHEVMRAGGSSFGRKAGSVEKFVTGRSAGSRGKPADVTRQLEMELAEVLQMFGYPVEIRPAADVKPWASDKRLVAAGIVPSLKGMHGDMNHAYDGARHALYGARDAGIVQDPLLKAGKLVSKDDDEGATA